MDFIPTQPITFLSNVGTGYFNELNREEKIDLVIDLFVPWFFDFYVGWYHYTQNINPSTMWIDYETLVHNKQETITNILNYYGLYKTPEEIIFSINKVESDKKRIRFNKGISGRGVDELSVIQKNAILNYCNYYPNIKFYGFIDTN